MSRKPTPEEAERYRENARAKRQQEREAEDARLAALVPTRETRVIDPSTSARQLYQTEKALSDERLARKREQELAVIRAAIQRIEGRLIDPTTGKRRLRPLPQKPPRDPADDLWIILKPYWGEE